MRYISVFILSFLILSGKAATPEWGDMGNGTYKNPVLCADFSDPDVIRVGNKYYMVASDFHFMGMQLLESTDMVNWNYASRIYDRLDFDAYDTMQRYGGGSWAPALRYHDGEFYVYFCTPHEGLFMSKAASAYGPWSPLLLVKAVEKWEDPCPFWDEDGRAYLGHSLYGAGPIILHRMSEDGTRLLDDGVTVYTGPVAEGTKIHKFGGKYYMSIPEGGVRGGWQTILRADDIYGPYERRVVLETGTTDINGPHQGALVDTPDGEWWFYHFQETDAMGRVLHLQPVRWTDDGWPRIGVDYDGNGVGEPVAVWPKPKIAVKAATTAIATSDNFATGNLGLQWQWNHNPDNAAWSLADNYGCLTLKARKAKDFRHAENTLTQKSLGRNCTSTISMDINKMADGQRSGLACMGKQNHLLGVKKEGDKCSIYVSNDTVEIHVADIEGTLAPVYLRLNLDFDGKAYNFEYSKDGREYLPAGDTFYTRWGNWKGVRPALYTYNIKQDAGEGIFNWFDMRHDGPCAPRLTAKETDAPPSEDEIVASIALTSFPNRIVDVEAQSQNETTTDRSRIQAAIDKCSEAGGGTVMLGKRLYHIDGNIELKSNVNLCVPEGAEMRFSGRGDDFLPEVFTRWEGTELYGRSPMIYTLHAVNVAITGKGVINAQAGVEMGEWGTREVADRDRLRAQGEDLVPVGERRYGKDTVLRPVCVEFVGCSRVLVEGVTIKDSPFWTIHPLYCDNVIVRSVTIDSHFANNDGCDPESSSNVLIENCNFNVGDDAIAIKAGRDADGRRVGRPSQNIVIRNCVFNSQCNGLCIGSEMSGGVSNVHMHDISIGTVKNAIYFKSNRDRGGYIRDVYVSDISVRHTLGAVLRFETNYFGFRGGNHASQYERFEIRNVMAEQSDNYALFISGYPEKPVRDVLVENMNVKSAPKGVYLHCTDGVMLRNVSVNGVQLSTTIADTPEEITLDIY